MSRGEHWSTPKAIKANFKAAADPKRHAGVPVYADSDGIWVDDSYRHVQVIGNTGEGKTQGVVLPFARDCLHRGESLILLNCKDECYQQLACHVPQHYQKFCVNFNDLWSSPNAWDPLRMIRELYQSDRPVDRDRASVGIHDFWTAISDRTTYAESFWPESATDYLRGLTRGLLETAKPEQVNLESIESMLTHAEGKFGPGSYTRMFMEMLPENSQARCDLSAYVHAPHETRMSIYACARRGLAQFGLSRGLRQLLMQDDLDILHLDLDRPFALFVVMPQETDVYASLAALLVDQFVKHLLHEANHRSGKLPIRTNVVLEELSKVGKSIPSLPNLMATGRSVGLRLMLVLQSKDQLTEVYGKTKADAINACVGVNIGFSTNCSHTLREWSADCGQTMAILNGQPCFVPLVSPIELQEMAVGEALVRTKNLKFRTRLPFYYQLTAAQPWTAPAFQPGNRVTGEALNFREFVKELKRQEMLAGTEAMRGTATGSNKRNADGSLVQPPRPESVFQDEDPLRDLPSPETLLSTSQLRNLGTLRPKDCSKSEASKGFATRPPDGFNVIILNDNDHLGEVAKVVATLLHTTFPEAVKKLTDPDKLVSIPFRTRGDAEAAQKDLAAAGATAVITPMLGHRT